MLIEFTKEELLQMKSIDELMEAAENNDCEYDLRIRRWESK